MSQRLIYVMDPMCSWCWGFAPVIDSIVALAPELTLHLVAGGLRPGSGQQLDERTRSALAEHWQAVEAASGQPFVSPARLPDSFVYDTEPSCRALLVGRGLDALQAWPFARLMQQAFYLEAMDLSDTRVLLELAVQAGYDRTQFAEAYGSELARAAVAADFSWTRDLGIAGFPTLLAERDGHLALLANGYQSRDVVIPLFERWLAAGRGIASA